MASDLETLARCLRSAAPIADEIIVVDTGSTDKTPDIAAQFTDKVLHFDWIDDFAAARNFSFEQAVCDYCMWLDADDVLPEKSAAVLLRLKREMDPDTDVVMLPYHTAFDEEGNATFTYYRERLVRRQKGLRWVGEVHEAIPPQGRVLYAEAPVEHRKVKPREPGRNRRIFESILRRGGTLDARQRFYYARELLDTGEAGKAAELFADLLSKREGWTPNLIEACRQLASCYQVLGMRDKVLPALLQGLSFGPPRAELCCALGGYFLENGPLDAAVFWYETALSRPEDAKTGGFVNRDCRGYIPLMQLCLCYDRLGQKEKAARYNERAGRIKPHDAAYLHNKQYFQGVLSASSPGDD